MDLRREHCPREISIFERGGDGRRQIHAQRGNVNLSALSVFVIYFVPRRKGHDASITLPGNSDLKRPSITKEREDPLLSSCVRVRAGARIPQVRRSLGAFIKSAAHTDARILHGLACNEANVSINIDYICDLATIVN